MAGRKRSLRLLLETLLTGKLRQQHDYDFLSEQRHQSSQKNAHDYLNYARQLSKEDWGEKSCNDRGDLYEQMHMSWLLAMRAHAARTAVDEVGRLKQLCLLNSNSERDVISSHIHCLSKANLEDTHNGQRPFGPSLDLPFLVHHRYAIKQIQQRKHSVNENLSLMTDDELFDLLLGFSAYRNSQYGAGFDYVIADWISFQDFRDYRILLTFFEMRYSGPTSVLKQSMQSIENKAFLVERAFAKVKDRLADIAKMPVDYRIVFECFRETDEDFKVNHLPEKVLLFSRQQLQRAYGPHIGRGGNFGVHNVRTDDGKCGRGNKDG